MRDNTEFWCCERLKKDLDFDGLTLNEFRDVADWEYCCYCGRKLDTV